MHLSITTGKHPNRHKNSGVEIQDTFLNSWGKAKLLFHPYTSPSFSKLTKTETSPRILENYDMAFVPLISKSKNTMKITAK